MDLLKPLENRFVNNDAQPAFWGRAWAFPPSFNASERGLNLVEGEFAIGQSLSLLMSTMPGERKMQPSYGIDLSELQFEPLSIELETRIIDRITRGVLRFEPRVSLDDIALFPIPGQALIEIKLGFTILSTNNRTNLVYPFFIREGTDL